MEFEDLQTVWKSQNSDDLYTINEEALYAQIRQKSQSVNHKLNVYELLMFLGNLIIGLVLLFNVLTDDGPPYQYLLPVMYIGFSIGTLILRKVRRQKEIQFDLTLLGELDKAIYQIDYLIHRGRSMMIWYMLPLFIVLAVTLALDSKLLWAVGTIALALPVAYFGGRWEINKWYLPKKKELLALREKLRAE